MIVFAIIIIDNLRPFMNKVVDWLRSNILLFKPFTKISIAIKVIRY